MSDLQIGLLMLGVLVVGAVVGFNWWQERQFRRRTEASFPDRHDDVLMNRAQPDSGRTPASAGTTASRDPGSRNPAPWDPEQTSRIEPRIEPGLEPEPAAFQASRHTHDAAAAADGDSLSGIEYVAEIRAGEFIEPGNLADLRQHLAALGRKFTLAGFDYQSKSWQPLGADGARYTAIRAALQLVDRSGPVKTEQLQAFGDVVRATAQQMSAIAELPEFAPSLEQATEIDAFCADVDVVVGINVIANAGQVFHGTKIRALAEASGLQLQSGGIFHLRDEHGRVLFSLENQEKSPFQTDLIRNLTTPGITFLLDVPRAADGLKVFDRMLAMSRSFAESLDGTLADDNRALLNDSGLDKIRTQLRSIYASMARRGIPAGSPVALRLFS